MLGKQQQWIMYISFNPTVRLSSLRTWNIGVNSDPNAREYGYKATPNNVINSPTMREVGTTI